MKYWLRPANLKYYDVFKAFDELGTIDWRSRNNFSVGDIVYIYCSVPLQRITHKCKVVAIDIEDYESIEDSKYKAMERRCVYTKCIRMELITEIKKYVSLKDIGLDRCQGPRTITTDQSEIIDSNI